MAGLLDARGRPLRSTTTPSVSNKKAPGPITGDAFGAWAGRDALQSVTMPGGGIVQFDLNKLTLSDFRTMRDHYQVNASLAVLSFMQHQSDWHIECDDTKIKKAAEEEVRKNWTMLNRSMSTANWAGFSPAVLDWENEGSRTTISKVKDLLPEECVVNWKQVEGWAPPGQTPPKFNVYDGIRQFGQRWPTPVENTFWYPLLMENGNYYGRKLLRPAFQSWFFSILLHLYANRYYERFGEPTPVGRAPYDEDITIDNTTVNGAEYMLTMLQRLRSRGVVVLPNDKTQDVNGRPQFDYDIQYLESQMRGADFERYMTRLDEEISIGMFTPILLLRTADVGSYNLGQGHERIYQVMLNSMNDDRKMYIDKYILSKWTDYNYGVNAPRPRIVFRKLGSASSDLLTQLILQLTGANKAKVDLEELGQMAGMSLKEIRQTIAKPDPNAPVDPNAPAPGTSGPDAPAPAHHDPAVGNLGRRGEDVRAVAKEINVRVRGQVENAMKNGTFGDGFRVNMGFKRRIEQTLNTAGTDRATERTNELYNRMDHWLKDVVTMGADEFNGADDFMGMFDRVLNYTLEEVLA